MGIFPLENGQFVGQKPMMLDRSVRQKFAQVIDALGLDYKSASLAAGLGETYVRDVIKRSRGKETEIRKILKSVSNVDLAYFVFSDEPLPDDILDGLSIIKKVQEAKAAPVYTVTVVGRIGTGAVIDTDFENIGPEGLFEIETSLPIAPGCIAFEVEGNSMWPRYLSGDVVICEREGAPAEEIVGVEAAVRLADGRRLLKNLRRGSRRGLYTLESHNDSPIDDVQIVWAAEIEQVVRAKKWRRLSAR